MTNVNITTKEVLAKLMATENIDVVHENSQTASFDVKNRKLTLPMWENMRKETYDHLVGHEVGHALYTPTQEWMDIVNTKGEGFRTFLNVVEDARIEKLIQRRYPGLRHPFIKSYRKMLADGFFGKDADEVDTFKLIDRLNVYFKCGASIGVAFSDEEKVWVKEIGEAETFEEVIDITNRLYQEAVEDQQKQMDSMQEMILQMQNDQSEEDDDQDDYDFSYDEDGDEDQDQSDYVDGEELDDSEHQKPFNYDQSSQSSDVNDFEPFSETDKNLNKNISENYNANDDLEVRTVKLSNEPVEQFIIGYDNIIAEFNKEYVDCANVGQKLLKEFMLNNKKTINYMVKEFEMRKSALAYSRATISKTGVIDTVKMNNYKFNDDIFRKMTVLPNGKNHGMIMIVDWSGSMHDDLRNTIDQLLNMIMFCRQVNIPFEVYSFTDYARYDNRSHNKEKYLKYLAKVEKDDLIYEENFSLIRLFDSKMNSQKLNKMASILLGVANYYNNRYKPADCRDESYGISPSLQLGGTPLAETIMATIQIYKNFKNKYKCDIVNTIILTDGEGDYIQVIDDVNGKKEKGCVRRYTKSHWSSSDRRLYILDPVTKVKRSVNSSIEVSNTLLKMFRDITGEKIIGYRILPSRKNNFIRDYGSHGQRASYNRSSIAWEKIKSEKWITIPGYGYNEFFGILGGQNLSTNSGSLEIDSDASVAKIRTAFKKSRQGNTQSRAMLNKFIEIIS